MQWNNVTNIERTIRIRAAIRRTRGATIKVGATVMMLSGIACNMPPSHTDLKRVMAAESDFRNHRFKEADEKLTAFLRDFPDCHESAEAYCLRSLCNVELKRRAKAESDAQTCVKLAQDSTVKANAHATLATLLYEDGKTDQALDHYSAALKVLPDKPPADLLRYRFGICLQRAGRWQDARREFASVYQRYPNSDLAPHARRLYGWSVDGYAIQAGAFRESDAASDLNQQLRRVGLPSRVDRVARSGEWLHTVYVGNYTTYREATSALPVVRRVVRDAFVMPQ
jgi:tetratricopeptide (TPR) repeat protein